MAPTPPTACCSKPASREEPIPATKETLHRCEHLGLAHHRSNPKKNTGLCHLDDGRAPHLFLDPLFPEPLRTLALPSHGKRAAFLDERAPVAFLRHTWGDIVPGDLGKSQNAIELD